MQPSFLADLAYHVTQVIPLSTSTSIHYIKTSQTDSGTKLTTSRQLDLTRLLHHGTSGGLKPLDVTVHPRASGPPRFKGLSVLLGGRFFFRPKGENAFITVKHWTRAATAGAGSSWVALKTDVKRFKMGTDTQAKIPFGLVSSVPGQSMQRYYKANITYAARLASNTGSKDSTSGLTLFVNSALVVLHGADAPQTIVPAQV